MRKRVTIYCASSRKTPVKYISAAKKLARVLFEKDAHIVYGGGKVGLMGTIADEYLHLGGAITGIIPEFMVKVEWAHPGVADMRIVADMHERKKQLMENTDLVIALPGGTGTLEEIMEVISLKRLGKFTPPIIFLNTDGFYSPLQVFMQKMVDEFFLRPEHVDLWQMIDDPEAIWSAYQNAKKWGPEAIDKAGV